MTSLSLISLVVIVFGALTRFGYGRALAVGGATSAGSAVVAAGFAVPTFYATAVGTAVALLAVLLGRRSGRLREPLPPGAVLLVLFFIWSAFVTVVAPVLFDNMRIVTPVTPRLVAGTLTSSNIAQVTYLLLGICVVVFLARSSQAPPQIMGLVTGLSTLLSFWSYLGQHAGVPFPSGLFDNSPSFAFISTAAGDVHRFRGITSEPSALAGVSLVTIAYMLPRAAQLRGLRGVGALTIAGIAIYLGIVSTSTTFVVAGVAAGLLMGLSWLVAFLARRSALSRLLSLVGCGAIVAGLWLLPTVTNYVGSSVSDKLTSQSYADRSSADADSFRVFLDSHGFGVGLGSARASSFVPTILSATGLIGTLLFLAAISVVVWRSLPDRDYRPVLWALVALLVSKVAAGPDLSDSSGVLWLSLGLLSHAALNRRTADVAPPSKVHAGSVPASQT